MKPRIIVLSIVISCALVASPYSSAVIASTSSAAPAGAELASQSEQTGGGTGIEALRQGRKLLKQGKADQALPLLQSALKSFTDAGAVRGQAATNDALGDLYSRQGQHRTALAHYQKAHEGFQQASGKAAIVKRVTGVGDEEFNANLMLAKIGEAHYRVGNIAESGATYSRMQVKKPDTSTLGAVKKTGGLFGSIGGLGRSIARGDGASISTGASVVGTISAVQQQFEVYRQSILYATYELGLGRVDYFNDNLESAKKHFTNTVEATAGSIPVIGKIGQMRRFRVAANTSLGDVALKQG
ncbi:MAG TPA: tetratricopeptide repeat protein, partial [Pyrinomonadaceae bacterium]|nr:tetratricopeptide repeat protein [Pyrinomonadaceae bacterium]